jgi:hypothetical protein
MMMIYSNDVYYNASREGKLRKGGGVYIRAKKKKRGGS